MKQSGYKLKKVMTVFDRVIKDLSKGEGNMANKNTVETPRIWTIRWIEQLSLPQFVIFAAICSAITYLILSQLI